MSIGSWNSYTEPEWVSKLEYTSNYELEKTGLSREKIKTLLQQLNDMGIIK